MRLVRLAMELRVELAGDEKRMLRQFDDLHELAIGRMSAEPKPSFLKTFAVGVVEFVPVTMPFVYNECAIKPRRLCSHHKLAGLRAQPHGATLFRHPRLFVEHRNYRMRCVRIKLGRMRLVKPQ